MSLRISRSGDQFELKTATRQPRTDAIRCEIDGDETLDIYYPLMADLSYGSQDLHVRLFVKHDLAEDNIFQVYDAEKKERIGWCFPIQALSSIEHSFASNEHFLHYAYPTALTIIEKVDESLYYNKPDIEGISEVKLDDFFPPVVAAIAIHKSKVQDPATFNLDSYLPSLAKYGYFPLTSRNPSNLVFSQPIEGKVRLSLSRTSPDLIGFPYISNVFTNLLPYESNPLLRFFYLYQIIEILIAKIYDAETEDLIDYLREKDHDAQSAKEIFEKLQERTAESKRLELLRSKYTNPKTEYSDLHAACNRFLAELGREKKDGPLLALYAVRNTIFHQFRSVQIAESISPVNGCLQEILPWLLAGFRIPKLKSTPLNLIHTIE